MLCLTADTFCCVPQQTMSAGGHKQICCNQESTNNTISRRWPQNDACTDFNSSDGVPTRCSARHELGPARRHLSTLPGPLRARPLWAPLGPLRATCVTGFADKSLVNVWSLEDEQINTFVKSVQQLIQFDNMLSVNLFTYYFNCTMNQTVCANCGICQPSCSICLICHSISLMSTVCQQP